jgi:hypothetical protein
MLCSYVSGHPIGVTWVLAVWERLAESRLGGMLGSADFGQDRM